MTQEINLPFNIYYATDEEVAIEYERREKEKGLIEEELKRYLQFYKENALTIPPGGLIDNQEGYLKLKNYRKELSISVIYQQELCKHLKKLELERDKLTGFEILREVRNVLRLKVPYPEWLLEEYDKRFLPVAEGQKGVTHFGHEKSFGKYKFKGKGLEVTNFKGLSHFKICVEVEKLINQGMLTTANSTIENQETVFEYLAENTDWELTASAIREIYYYCKTNGKLLDSLIHRVGMKK